MKKSAVEKALEARKKRLRDRRRVTEGLRRALALSVAKARSENARRAALIRWGKWDKKRNRPKEEDTRRGKWDKKKNRPKKTPPKKTPPKKTPPKKTPPKKTPPKKNRKTRAELERELRNEKRRRIYAEKKQKEETRKRKEQAKKLKLIEEGVRDMGLGPELFGEESRFVRLDRLPEKMAHETDEQHARRIIAQMAHEAMYSVEEAYKILAEELEITHSAVFSLWLSPDTIPGAA